MLILLKPPLRTILIILNSACCPERRTGPSAELLVVRVLTWQVRFVAGRKLHAGRRPTVLSTRPAPEAEQALSKHLGQ